MSMNKITKGYPNWDVPYNENVDEYNNTIGNEELVTTSKTIKGAINEIHNVADDVTTINADISNLKKSVAQNTSSLNAKVNKTSIVNNCNTTEEGFIADARQLKELNDKIPKVGEMIYPNSISLGTLDWVSSVNNLYYYDVPLDTIKTLSGINNINKIVSVNLGDFGLILGNKYLNVGLFQNSIRLFSETNTFDTNANINIHFLYI